MDELGGVKGFLGERLVERCDLGGGEIRTNKRFFLMIFHRNLTFFIYVFIYSNHISLLDQFFLSTTPITFLSYKLSPTSSTKNFPIFAVDIYPPLPSSTTSIPLSSSPLTTSCGHTITQL